MKSHYQVLILGGGTAGIMTAVQLKRRDRAIDIAIIEPSRVHWYQPAWTLVGAGAYDMRKTERTEASFIPAGTDWIVDRATEIRPEENKVITANSGALTYDYLIVATGLVNDLSLIEGLEDALRKGVVCSNYIDPEYTWKSLQQFKGGNALFTQPATPIKCGGAPQKAMYLASDYFQKTGIASSAHVVFLTPGSVIFGIKMVADTLMKVIRRYRINFQPFHTPVKIDADRKLAYFRNNTPEDKRAAVPKIPGAAVTGDLVELPFEFLHLAPPQTAPAFIKESALATEAGWVDVHIHSLQHKKYCNVFALGDVANLPTAKTGAAVRKQAPVVVDNILKLIHGRPADNKSYMGYSFCPLVTGYGKMALAEFNYKNELTPDPMLRFLLIFKSYKEHWRLWLLKKFGLPYLYWNKMLKGKM